MTQPISEKQKRVLDAMRAFVEQHGRQPSVRELATALGLAPSSVHQHFEVLSRLGYVENGGGAHGWRLVDRKPREAALLAALFTAVDIAIGFIHDEWCNTSEPPSERCGGTCADLQRRRREAIGGAT